MLRKPGNGELDSLDMDWFFDRVPDSPWPCKTPHRLHLRDRSGQSYYRLLVWLSWWSHCRTIVEVGTYRGIGSICLGACPDVDVTTYDIQEYEGMAARQRNVRRLLIGPEEFPLIDDADLIYYDTVHDGEHEHRFLEYCLSKQWHGIIVWDDIHLDMSDHPEYAGIRRWWDELTIPKLDWTDIGHACGTGVTLL